MRYWIVVVLFCALLLAACGGSAEIDRFSKFTEGERHERIAAVKIALVKNAERSGGDNRAVWNAKLFQGVSARGVGAHEIIAQKPSANVHGRAASVVQHHVFVVAPPERHFIDVDR